MSPSRIMLQIFRSCLFMPRRRMSSNVKILKSKEAEQFFEVIAAKLENFRIGETKKVSSDEISYWTNVLDNVNDFNSKLKEWKQLETSMNGSDEDWRALAGEEMMVLSRDIENSASKLSQSIVRPTEFDSLHKCQVEFSCGVGGVEAMLFTKELVDMYRCFAEFKGWDWSYLQSDNGQHGGIRNCIVALQGNNVYRDMRFEGGVHRVQRIPVTDKSRLHTSTASISVQPEPDEVEAFVSSNDVKIETMRASGPGGQNVNKRSTAVRVTHKDTGISVHCMEERFQHINLQIAFRRLASILLQRKVDAADQNFSRIRKLQVGSKARSEKIRTYNFKDDKVTDHRLHRSWDGVREVLAGDSLLDSIISALRELDLEEKVEFIIQGGSD
ncbi:hypothetical protein AB6A40_004333 [Gnathostoma spinigerum]|uniref:Prokaryotic-type class I peptide chain release factors domain-containing protein n=1 Tax=Gnathostoma spinigerum TaxID=75299 RepID=A0ABD6EC59_9BILA